MAIVSSSSVLALPCNTSRAGSAPAFKRREDLAAARHVEMQPLGHHDPLNGRARERLRREGHIAARPPAAERGQVVTGPPGERVPGDDDDRGAELGGHVVEATVADHDGAVAVESTARREQFEDVVAHVPRVPSTAFGSVRTMASEPLDDARNRRARVAVAALFLTNGALFANLLPRFPGDQVRPGDVQRRLRRMPWRRSPPVP